MGKWKLGEYYQTTDIELIPEKSIGRIEVTHWHLDVTFHEDSNKTLDKIDTQNQNILRKLALSILKLLDVGKKEA
jgi:predicted transposase YbfD/YdcC